MSIISLSCSPFTNHHDDLVLDCGENFDGREPILVMDSDGTRLRGDELEAFELRPEGQKPLTVSSKGCFARSDLAILIRHKSRPVGFVGHVGHMTQSPVILKSPLEPRLKSTCAFQNIVRDQLQPKDFLSIHNAAQAEAYELTLSLVSESTALPIFETSLRLNGAFSTPIQLPESLAEGTHQLTLTLHDLIRQEADPLTCPLVIDRTPPQPRLDVDARVTHVKGPQVLIEVDDRGSLQLNTNEGEIFYCVQKLDEPLCKVKIPYLRALSLASWQGEVLLRYQAVDAAGNESPILSHNLLIANSFQESEVQSLANSSRAASGKSIQVMLDALRAEEKRRQLPSSIQRDRYSLSTYWAMLKNYVAPQAPLLTVRFSEQGVVGADSDISVDGRWACYGYRFGGELEAAYLFRVADQKTITLPVPGTSCRFSPNGNQVLVVHSGAQNIAHLVDTTTLAVQTLPPVPLDQVRRIYMDAQSQVYLVSRNTLLRWSPLKPDAWDTLYTSEQDFAVNFGARHAALLFPGSMTIYDLMRFQKKAEIQDELIYSEAEVGISPNGAMLMVAGGYMSQKIPVWVWDERESKYIMTQEFEPHIQRESLGVVINDRNEEILLEHAGGTASLWRYSNGKFVLLNKEIGVRGDMIINNVETHRPHSVFLSNGRVGLLSSHFLSFIQAQSEGRILSSGIRRFVADGQGEKILAQDENGRIKLFLFDGQSLSDPKILTTLPADERHAKLAISESGQTAGAIINSQLKLWKLHGSVVQDLEHPGQDMNALALALSADGSEIAVAGINGTGEPSVSIWRDGQLQKTRYEFCLPQDSIFSRIPRSLKFLPQNDKLLISCVYGDAQIWDWKRDAIVNVSADTSIDSAVFHENGRSLIFDNDSVVNDQTFALQIWNEPEGVQFYFLNAASIEAIAGSRDFQLVASISRRDLIFWNPELNEKISVWDETIEPEFSAWDGDIAIGSRNLRTFVLNGHNELVYWPLATTDVYKSICSMLEPQIYALGLKGMICQ
jgi:WD40 repeat protein